MIDISFKIYNYNKCGIKIYPFKRIHIRVLKLSIIILWGLKKERT